MNIKKTLETKFETILKDGFDTKVLRVEAGYREVSIVIEASYNLTNTLKNDLLDRLERYDYNFDYCADCTVYEDGKLYFSINIDEEEIKIFNTIYKAWKKHSKNFKEEVYETKLITIVDVSKTPEAEAEEELKNNGTYEKLLKEKMWNKEKMQKLLDENDRAVNKAIVVIYSLQTEDEKINKQTSHSNGVGFSGIDAGIMSSYAEFIKDRGGLTPRQMLIGRRIIRKYWRQLVVIANDKIIKKEKEKAGA